MPRKRSGEAYFPSFLEPRRRSEQAIVAVVMEATPTAGPPARSHAQISIDKGIGREAYWKL